MVTVVFVVPSEISSDQLAIHEQIGQVNVSNRPGIPVLFLWHNANRFAISDSEPINVTSLTGVQGGSRLGTLVSPATRSSTDTLG